MARRLLGAFGCRGGRRRRPSAGDPVVPVSARASGRPRRRQRHLREGGERVRLRRPLLLGHRDLRGAVLHLHVAGHGAQRAAGTATACWARPSSGPRNWPSAGALYPWRTINGEEASAYYAAGTAQYHIDADISYAINKYVRATGDDEFLAREGIDILVQTARMWADLGFWRKTEGNEPSFRIHGVTGPDEYTTVVNDNLYTNVMARFNLRCAAESVRKLADTWPDQHAKMVARLGPGAGRGRRVGAGRRGHGDPVGREPRHPPPRRAVQRARGVGPGQHSRREAPAAAALPPAGDLPLPGAQAGRCGAGAVPAGRALLARGEALPTSSTTTRSPRGTRRCPEWSSRSSRPRWATTSLR